ncbi:MAG: hypothetical protein ACLFVP_09335 [Candidatus Bathyarchaeia archaeon]
MAPKWMDIAERNLEKGDEIEKTYPAELNDKYGYILMSNQKVQFISEEGFLRKSYDLMLDMSYEKIQDIKQGGKYELEITDKEGEKHRFKTRELVAAIPERELKELAKRE